MSRTSQIDDSLETDRTLRNAEIREQIIGSFCHDMRQPLNAALLRASALAERSGDAESRALLADLSLNLQELSMTSEAVFDAVRLSRSGIRVRIAPVSLTRVLLRLKLVLEERARAKGLRIRLRANGLVADTDEWLLTRILQNLASNAVKFTGTGAVSVVCRQHGDGLRCDVWDTGPGMDARTMSLLFEPFQPSGHAWADADEALTGTGLGLWNTREFIRLLRGTISVVTLPGRGSRFRIDIPCAVENNNRVIPKPPARGAVPETPAAESPRVTILDENADALDRAQRLFVHAGWTCTAFDHPLQFIASLNVPGPLPAVVIIPARAGAIGADFLVRILMSRYESVRVIVVSATEDDEMTAVVRRWKVDVIVGALTEATVEALRRGVAVPMQ